VTWKADVTRSLLVPSGGPGATVELTEPVNQLVYQSEVRRGLCFVFTPHRDTTLELADPTTPQAGRNGGPPRNQVTLLVVDRRLFLAPGQQVILRELEGEAKPSRRRLLVRVLDGTEPLEDPFPDGGGGEAAGEPEPAVGKERELEGG